MSNRKRTPGRKIQTVAGKPNPFLNEADKTRLRVALRGKTILKQIKHSAIPL